MWWQKRSKIYDSKLRIFETLMGTRNMTCEDKLRALNTIDIVFYKDKKVRKACEILWNEVCKINEKNYCDLVDEKYLSLLEEIAKVLRFNYIKRDTLTHYFFFRRKNNSSN